MFIDVVRITFLEATVKTFSKSIGEKKRMNTNSVYSFVNQLFKDTFFLCKKKDNEIIIRGLNKK